MRDAALTMLGGGFFLFLGVTLMPMTMLRVVVMTVNVIVERVVKHLMSQRHDVEAQDPEATGDVCPMMPLPAS